MAQYTNDLVMDAALDAAKGTRLFVCEGQPANLAAVAAAAVHTSPATPVYSPASGGVDGVVSGRRHTVQAVTGILVDNAALARTADHVSVDDSSDLLVVTTIANPQAVSNGTTIDLGSWDHEFRDP